MPFDPATDKLVIPFVTGTRSQWTSSGAILPAGVPGFDLTTKTFKVGDGVADWASLPALDNKVNAMTMTLDSVDGGTTFAATTVPALTSTEIGDGNLRRFRVKFNQANTPDGSNRTKVTFSGSGTARHIQNFESKNVPKGGVTPGVFYDAWVGNVEGAFRLWINVPSEIMPEVAIVADIVTNSMSANYIKRRGDAFIRRQVPGDFDALLMKSISESQNVGLQAAERLVTVISASANLDLTWVRPGTAVECLVANAAGTASAVIEVPPGATVIGVAPSSLYAATNQTRFVVRRSTVQTVDLWHFQVIHGSLSPLAGSPAARARCIIMAGQSLALRFCQGFGPMAIEEAFDARSVNSSTRLLNVAAGSSSLFYANDNTVAKTNHWWDERTDTAGPLAIAAAATINSHLASKPAAEPSPSLMIFNIGQNDADDIAASGITTMTSVRANYRKVVAYIRTNTGLSSLVTAIDFLGADDGGAYSDAQCQMFRRAQLQACQTDGGADDALIRPGAEFFDLPRLWDDVHICLSGQELQAERYADLWLALIGGVAATALRMQGVEFVSHAFTSPNIHEIRLRSDFFNGTRYGFRRPDEAIPGGIDILPDAVPSLADAPFQVRTWSIVATAITNELIFRLETYDASASGVPVLNWGKGSSEAKMGNLIRSVLTERALRTYDTRPIV